MDFRPLYHGDRLTIINPHGDVGLITLWSPVRTVLRKLESLDPAWLDPAHSRIAAIGNLYGDGLLAMFCNLLHNPQIRHLVALGEDMKLGVPDEIAAFLARGLDNDAILGRDMKRIAGTSRFLPVPQGFDVARLQGQVIFHHLGKLSNPDLPRALRSVLEEAPHAGPAGPARIVTELKEASAADFAWLPSDAGGHQVIRRTPLEAWEELIFRAMRFGRPVELEKGPRLELHNARAVITEPADDPEEALQTYGFDPARFRAYQQKILDPALPEGISYTYGNRLRGFFDPVHGTADTLETAAALLAADVETRGAYISLWDTGHDLVLPEEEDERSRPCLTTLFFRKWEERLSLTATYRAHNLLTAWLENVYGLMAIQKHVAARAGIAPGRLTVISHSLAVNPRESRYQVAEQLVAARKSDDDHDHATGKFRLRQDPHGYFVVSTDEEAGLIVADHMHENIRLNRYQGRTSREVEDQIARDIAVSLVSHALWLGRELARAEAKLKAAGTRSRG